MFASAEKSSKPWKMKKKSQMKNVHQVTQEVKMTEIEMSGY